MLGALATLISISAIIPFIIYIHIKNKLLDIYDLYIDLKIYLFKRNGK